MVTQHIKANVRHSESLQRTLREMLEEGARVMRQDIAEFDRRANLHKKQIARKARQLDAARL